MLRQTLAITALLALTGCTTMPKQTQRVSSAFVGRPVAELDARFGDAFVFGQQRQFHQYRIHRQKADWSMLIPTGSTTSQVSGYVDGRPFQAEVSTPHPARYTGASDSSSECILNATADAAGIVTDISLAGDTWACRKFS